MMLIPFINKLNDRVFRCSHQHSYSQQKAITALYHYAVFHHKSTFNAQH